MAVHAVIGIIITIDVDHGRDGGQVPRIWSRGR